MVAEAQTNTNRRNALTHNSVNGWGCILVPGCSSLAADEPCSGDVPGFRMTAHL